MQSVTVAVVGICGGERLRRCLAALGAQTGAPPFDVLVVCDGRVAPGTAPGGAFPPVRIIVCDAGRSPADLAHRAIREASGDVILLTEDSCVPCTEWVARLCAALGAGRSAAGGPVRCDPVSRLTDWAFCFVDFCRYAGRMAPGPTPMLSVCNVAYRRADLETVRAAWRDTFHETTVHAALRERCGPLWMVPEAEVRAGRHVRFADALRERYAFGRLLGLSRTQRAGPMRRAAYALLAPALPIVLLARLARAALSGRELAWRFARALPALTLLVGAWCWGEWLGYLTRRPPASLAAAREIDA